MRSRELITGLTLLTLSSLGGIACGAETGGQDSSASATTTLPRCLSLTSLSLVGPSKSGGENAKNTGACADIYDPQTRKDIGAIAADGAFIIHCRDHKPEALMVEVETPEQHVTGYTNLDHSALRQAEQGQFAAIPDCYSPVIGQHQGQTAQ